MLLMLRAQLVVVLGLNHQLDLGIGVSHHTVIVVLLMVEHKVPVLGGGMGGRTPFCLTFGYLLIILATFYRLR